MSIDLLWGEEEYTLNTALKALRDKYIDKEWASVNYKLMDEPDITMLTEALQTIPLGFGDLCIEVKSCSLFMRGQKKATTTDAQMSRLIKALEDLPERTHVIFVCSIPRDSGKKIDSVAKITKAVEKLGNVRAFEPFKSYQTKELSQWITQNVKAKGGFISTNAATALLNSTGSDLRKLDTEIDKLLMYSQPEKKITEKAISELCSSTENIFTLADHIICGNRLLAAQELDKLLEKDHPLRLVATLQTVARRWLKIKLESSNKDAFEISKIVGLPKFIVENDMKKLKPLDVEIIMKLKNNLTTCEFKIKYGELDAVLALETLISG